MFLELEAVPGLEVALQLIREGRQDVGASLRPLRQSIAERRRDARANGGTGAVEAALDGLDAGAGDPGDLGRRQPLHIPEDKDFPRRGIEDVEGLRERALDLTAARELVGARRGGRQGQGLPIERDLIGRCEFASPAPLHAKAPGDGVQPGRHRRVAAKASDGPGRREQRILQHFLGVLGVAAHADTEAEDAVLVPLEQRLDRGAVSGARGGEERVV